MKYILILFTLLLSGCVSIAQEDQNKTPERIQEATDCKYPAGECRAHHKHEGHEMHHHTGYPYHDFMLHY